MELTNTNDLFNLWKDTHLQNIIPENVKKSVYYDVKVRPFEYLKGMFFYQNPS